VRALSLKGEQRGDEPCPFGVAPVDREVVVDVREERHVGVSEQSVARVVRLGAHQLLGHAGPDLNRARQLLALHEAFHGERRVHDHGESRVVPFAVAGAAVHHRQPARDARVLRRLRNAVDVGAERNDRLAAAPRGDPRGRDAHEPFLHGEAGAFEHGHQVFRRFDFLKPELGVTKELVDHLCGRHRARFDALDRIALQAFNAAGVLSGRGLSGEDEGKEQHGGESLSEGADKE